MIQEETVEEAAERLYPEEWNWNEKEIFIKGAKWQAERMYSEEEVLNIIDKLFHIYSSDYRQNAKKSFEQFKKK
jgi:hypothetical protein